jgi:hypothetical protein
MSHQMGGNVLVSNVNHRRILIVFTTSMAIITRPIALSRCIQSLIAVPFFPSFVPEVIHALITSLPALRGVKDEKRSMQRHLKKNSNEKNR